MLQGYAFFLKLAEHSSIVEQRRTSIYSSYIKRTTNNFHHASGPCHPQPVTQITKAARSDKVVHHRASTKYVFKGNPRICTEYEEILRNRETPKLYLAQELSATFSLLLTSTEASE
jgi:hypothetical protein